jgi:hypothetical protein
LGQICPDIDELDVYALGSKVKTYLSLANWMLGTLAPATWLRRIAVWVRIRHRYGWIVIRGESVVSLVWHSRW